MRVALRLPSFLFQNFQININKPHFDCNNNKARATLDQFKMKAAREVGIQFPLKENIQYIANFMTT